MIILVYLVDQCGTLEYLQLKNCLQKSTRGENIIPLKLLFFHKKPLKVEKSPSVSTLLVSKEKHCLKYLKNPIKEVISFYVEKKWSQDETEILLKAASECTEGNYDPLFKKLPSRAPEEIVYHFLNLPFEQITSVNLFGGKKLTKAGTLTIDQREAINTMISQDSTALDDFNSPIIQHAAAFKMLLDKVKHEKACEHDQTVFKHERSEEVDSVLTQISDITEEHKDTILELEQCLKDNALLLKRKTEDKIKTLIKVLIELQLSKIEQKVTFLDEYEKFMFHELKLLELSRNQLKVERIKQEKEIKGV